MHVMETTRPNHCRFPWRIVAKEIPTYLKLVTETGAEARNVACEDLAAMADVGRAFERATGWRFEAETGDKPSETPNLMWSAPVNPGVGAAPGHVRLFSVEDPAGNPLPRCPLDDASALADAVGKLWGELITTRQALWRSEADLATGVPIVVREDVDTPPLSERLESVLRAGAEAVGCEAIALYLLDPATTELKLRSSWGLPRKRLAEPARPLRGALADLEALLGHAVVLTNDELRDYWKVPEEGFGTSVCVPVSSPAIPLGTLWAFCRESRDFNDAETNILEVVAGRIASDLEREVLADEAVITREHTKQVIAAQQSQSEQLPTVAPEIEGREVAAGVSEVESHGGRFYGRFALGDDRLAIVAGDALQAGVGGAILASALRATARTLANRSTTLQRLPETANEVLWTGSAGGQGAGLFHAVLKPAKNTLNFALAGPMRVLSITGDSAETLAEPTPPLGCDDEPDVTRIRRAMSDGELLVVYGTNCLAANGDPSAKQLDEQLAAALTANAKRSVAELGEQAAAVLASHRGVGPGDSLVVVIKRSET